MFREGRKGNCPHVSFLGRLRAAREIEVGFRSGGYGQQSMSSQWVNH